MPIRFYIPLPGPFVWTPPRRQRRDPGGCTPGLIGAIIVLALIIGAIKAVTGLPAFTIALILVAVGVVLAIARGGDRP